jgi:hypothetical protein
MVEANLSQNSNGKVPVVEGYKNARKTLTLTFRIDEEVIKQLQSEYLDATSD